MHLFRWVVFVVPPGIWGSSAGRMCHGCGLASCIGIQAVVAIAGGAEAVGSWYEIFGLEPRGVSIGKGVAGFQLRLAARELVACRIERVVCAGGRLEDRAHGWRNGDGAGDSCWHSGRRCRVTCCLGNGLLVGLSGGCLALLLLLTTLSPQSRMFPLPVSGKEPGARDFMAAELILALMDPALGLPGCPIVGRMLVDHGMGSWFQMGHACHFGGGLAGWLYGRWLLRRRVTLERLRRDRARREAG